MNRLVLVLLLCVGMLLPLSAFAQNNSDNLNHGEIGVFFNYTRLEHANANMYGVGGRLGFNVHPNVQLEGEMAYDFERKFNDTVTLPGGGGTATQVSPLRLVHGLFGPKFQFGTGAFRPFVTVKGGLLNFSTRTSVGGAISAIPNGDTNGVLYPGGGIEGFLGPVGIRIEAGDEIYFDNGANHNFRLAAGPQFRF